MSWVVCSTYINVLFSYSFFLFSLIMLLVGRHFRLSSMLSRDSVKSRLNSDAGMSFTEFTYQMFQAYDFLHLYRNFGCTVQLGGSDQWGNIVSGVDLIHRATGKEAHGVTGSRHMNF